MDKKIIDHQELNALISKICREISLDTWQPEYIIGITRGGLTPAVMISQYFNIPCHTLNVSLRDSNNGPESNFWMAEDAYGYDDNMETEESNQLMKKNILIVDDINDSGATFNWIMNDWQRSCLPDGEWDQVWNNNVRFAVIVDNLASRCSVGMDYVGLEVNKDESDVWIEFPWENWWAK